MWVYSTDSAGVPQSPPIQTVEVRNLTEFQISPNGKFAYASEWARKQPIDKIRLFTVDPSTGLLSKSKVVWTSHPNGPCVQHGFPYGGAMFLDGFNSDGSQLYELWSCDGEDDYGAFYYSRRIDQRTGELGAQKFVFSWGNSGGDGDSIWFTKKSMVDFHYFGARYDSVNIYPATGGSKPLFSCTGKMLQACQYAWSLYADSAGEYLFLQIAPDVVQIARIEMKARKIVDTGNYIPEQMGQLSPDRLLVYTQVPNSDPPLIDVYTFDPKTGAAQQGGRIVVWGKGYVLVPALRR